jgi:hypothetical protein
MNGYIVGIYAKPSRYPELDRNRGGRAERYLVPRFMRAYAEVTGKVYTGLSVCLSISETTTPAPSEPAIGSEKSTIIGSPFHCISSILPTILDGRAIDITHALAPSLSSSGQGT